MENAKEQSVNSALMQRELELECQADRTNIERDFYKDFCERQSAGILELQRQVAVLQQRIDYLETGGVDYQDKPWIDKIIQCIEDAGEPLTAAEIFQQLDRRDRSLLCQLKNPRRMLSVVICRGVKTDRLFKDCRPGTAKVVYDTW
jgi:hypothetical protein